MVLMILGALLIVGGFSSVIYGNYMNHDFSSLLIHYTSDLAPGFFWILLGIVAIVVGIIMVIIGASQMKSDRQLEQEARGVGLSSYQRNILKVYLSQLNNGVITKEEFQAKKEKLLGRAD